MLHLVLTIVAALLLMVPIRDRFHLIQKSDGDSVAFFAFLVYLTCLVFLVVTGIPV